MFDTGSSTTWMNDVTCVSTDACPNHSGYARVGYNESASSSSMSMNTFASIGYLGGDITGNGVRDEFSLPSAPASVWMQSFMTVNQSSWGVTAADGLLGLAFSTISDANTTTLVETLMKDCMLDEPRFGVYPGTETNDTGSVPGNGVLTLGASHEDKYVNGSIAWATLQVPGSESELWRVDMQNSVGMLANGTTTIIPGDGCWGVFDTGSGRISVPDPLIDSIYESIGMNYTAILHGHVIPLCEDFTDDWGIDFVFGNYYNPTTVRVTGTMLKQPGFATGEAKYCWPPFDPSDSRGLFLFGNEFLQNFYTIFDFGSFRPANYNARIGFGALKDEYKPVV